jgi:hypothetical protein
LIEEKPKPKRKHEQQRRRINLEYSADKEGFGIDAAGGLAFAKQKSRDKKTAEGKEEFDAHPANSLPFCAKRVADFAWRRQKRAMNAENQQDGQTAQHVKPVDTAELGREREWLIGHALAPPCAMRFSATVSNSPPL